jgi:hypothetical protein
MDERIEKHGIITDQKRKEQEDAAALAVKLFRLKTKQFLSFVPSSFPL